MNIQNPYLPADKQDIDNITTLCEEEDILYEPEKRKQETAYPEEFVFIALGAVIMLAAVFAYLNFIN